VKPILHNGEEMPIEHLAPMYVKYDCTVIGRGIVVRVIFANHCYTEEFDPQAHAKEQIILYDAPDRPRIFCPIRYGLSKQLPEIITELHTKRVHQTSQRRNYVYALHLRVENRLYEIYFMLQRAQADELADLRLTVESAYPVAAPTILPKRPNNIRFAILAAKVLRNQPVKFAAR
jgi:hypothetical protein